MAKYVSLDFETRSTTDLTKSGVYRYTEDPHTDILCMAYSLDEGKTVELWIKGQPFPADLLAAMEAGYYFRAWNAAFERNLWKLGVQRYGWPEIPLQQWVCSAAVGAAAALPRSLDAVAPALGLAEVKDAAGHRLMLQVSKPRSFDASGEPVWWEDADRLGRLYEYCRQDVRTECAVWAHLPPAMFRSERACYLFDQTINDRGISVDLSLVRSMERLGVSGSATLDTELGALTRGAVLRSTHISDLRNWLSDKGLETVSLDKEHITDMLVLDLPDDVRRVLEIRQLAAKTSVKKLSSMEKVVCADGRARGLLLYHGASTGRWSGRLIQPHNFPRGTYKIDEDVIADIRHNDVDRIETITGPVLDVLSSALRGTMVAKPGYELQAADFNAIEVRVLAWLAGETKLVRQLAEGRKLYEPMAARIFKRPETEIENPSFERTVAKYAVLGCGFGMGAPKFKAQTKKQGGIILSDELSEDAVNGYREEFQMVPKFWYALDDTAIAVVASGVASDVPGTNGRLRFALEHRVWLTLRLPSGRKLWYYRPKVVSTTVKTKKGTWVKESVEIWAQNSFTRQWEPTRMYGGVWAENAVSGTARDLLVEAMFRVQDAGIDVVLTVHDEVVTERVLGSDLSEFLRLMEVVPDWANGCPIQVAGWAGPRYRK